MGVAFYAYKDPAAGRVPVYSYRAHHGTDHYLTPNPNMGPASYWAKEGIAFYISEN